MKKTMIKNKLLLTMASLALIGFFTNHSALAMLDVEDGDYRIRCHTRNGGLRSLEAFPNQDVVRPRVDLEFQDQIWSVRAIEDGFHIISCSTKNGGVRYLEAFPNLDIIRPRAESRDQDQKWQFTRTDDGKTFHICCITKNGGRRALEAFPNQDVVRPRVESLDQDQKWELINVTTGNMPRVSPVALAEELPAPASPIVVMYSPYLKALMDNFSIFGWHPFRIHTGA